MLRKLIREPILHFMVLGALVFAAYGALKSPSSGSQDVIAIPRVKVEQLAAQFTLAWKRPPSPEQLKAMIDESVKEEVLVRQAIRLGLDKDDPVIRRRLRMKLEFLQNAEIDVLVPDDAELERFLKANVEKFTVEPQVSFQQIYFNPARRGGTIDGDMISALKVLRHDAAADPDQFGDPTMLPYQPQETGRDSIGRIFGDSFFDALAPLAPNTWSDPIRSDVGMHLVRVLDRTAGRVPDVSEVRDLLIREWLTERRKPLEESRYADMLGRHRVTIEWPEK